MKSLIAVALCVTFSGLACAQAPGYYRVMSIPFTLAGKTVNTVKKPNIIYFNGIPNDVDHFPMDIDVGATAYEYIWATGVSNKLPGVPFADLILGVLFRGGPRTFNIRTDEFDPSPTFDVYANGVNIDHRTGNQNLTSYLLPNVGFGPGVVPVTIVVPSLPGKYQVQGIRLTDVSPASAANNLTNASIRGWCSPPNSINILFAIRGPGVKRLAIRARGPSLAPAGITNPLPNPRVRCYTTNGTLDVTNEDWGSLSAADKADLAAAGYTPTDPLEAALIVNATAQPGTNYYTVSCYSSGGEGIALIEFVEF